MMRHVSNTSFVCRVYAGSNNSPGPNDNVYNGHNGSAAADSGYVNANSPQPNPFPAIPINRVSRSLQLLQLLNFNYLQ